MGHIRAAFARVIDSLPDGHNGAEPDACTGFLQVPRDSSRFCMELGAPARLCT